MVSITSNKPAIAEPTERYQVASVTAAFDLLFSFLDPINGAGELGVSELARRSDQTKNQTFRLLQTMVAAGVVIQHPERRTYALGYRLLELGSAAQSRSNLVHAAKDVLDRLSRETQDLIILGVLTADFAAIPLDLREVIEQPSLGPVGSRFALHAGAGSKLLFAFSSPEYIEDYLRIASPLKRFTQFTCVQPTLLKEELAQIRANGYALSFKDLDLNRCSIAVPIRDREGDVIATISISSSTARFREEDRRRKLALLMDASDEVSTRLGHTPAAK